MGHFIGSEERTYYVEDDGRVWDSPAKNLEFDPETLSPMGSAAPVEDNDDDTIKELKAIRRDELEDMQWGELRALHKSVAPDDERNLKKPQIIEGIIKQEFA